MNVIESWISNLKYSGYNHTCESKSDFLKLTKLPRVWRRILSKIAIKPGCRCFEVGCGGGIHLVRLALNGYSVSGIDCSPDVVVRAKNFIEQVALFDKKVKSISILVGDFLSDDYYKIEGKYNLVFDFGVVEHFLDRKDRLEFFQRKAKLAKENGYVVSVVPSGIHPYRTMQKERGLGGYKIPEIDYTPTLLKIEMLESGASDVIVLPHNIFGYLNLFSGKTLIVRKAIYYLFQAFPQNLFSQSFLEKHAFSYIAIGRVNQCR